MSDAKNLPNRWLIAIMGTLLQLCLGTVYAWSYFQNPLRDTYGWSNSETAWCFCLAICFLGLAAAWGGVNLSVYGPTKLAMAGGALFGAGYLIASYALYVNDLVLLYLGYGVIGGSGLGLGYVTPVATAAKWFPDRKGFITGMVVMGFGLGAFMMSKMFAPLLMTITKGNLVAVFRDLGVIFLMLTIPIGSFLVNPPAGYVPEGYTEPAAPVNASGQNADDVVAPLSAYLLSPKFFMMWWIFFCNITAGIAIIGFQSPLLQDLYVKSDPRFTEVATLKAKDAEEKKANAALPASEPKKELMTAEERTKMKDMIAMLAGFGATLIGISALFNGIGRFFWGGLSDKIGRTNAFRALIGTQIFAFVALLYTGNPWLFGAIFCYILLCYGGGFGTMPSYVTTVYGAKLMPVVYGTILTAWSAAGIVGPQLVAVIKDRFPAQASTYTFYMGAAFLAAGLLVSLFLNDNRIHVQSAQAEPKAA